MELISISQVIDLMLLHGYRSISFQPQIQLEGCEGQRAFRIVEFYSKGEPICSFTQIGSGLELHRCSDDGLNVDLWWHHTPW